MKKLITIILIVSALYSCNGEGDCHDCYTVNVGGTEFSASDPCFYIPDTTNLSPLKRDLSEYYWKMQMQTCQREQTDSSNSYKDSLNTLLGL